MVLLSDSSNKLIANIIECLNFLQIENKYFAADLPENHPRSTFIFFQDPYLDYQEDLEEKLNNAITFCADSYSLFVYIDTVHLFGLTEFTSVDETHPHKPYGQTGKLREKAYELIRNKKNLNYLILRFPDFIGRGSNVFFNDFFEAKSNFLNWPGLTQINHEFISVKKAAEIVSQMIAKILGQKSTFANQEYNLSGSKFTIEQIAASINELYNISVKIRKYNPLFLWLLARSNPKKKYILENTYLYTKPVFLNSKKYEDAFGKLEMKSLEDILKENLEEKNV